MDLRELIASLSAHQERELALLAELERRPALSEADLAELLSLLYGRRRHHALLRNLGPQSVSAPEREDLRRALGNVLRREEEIRSRLLALRQRLEEKRRGLGRTQLALAGYRHHAARPPTRLP